MKRSYIKGGLKIEGCKIEGLLYRCFMRKFPYPVSIDNPASKEEKTRIQMNLIRVMSVSRHVADQVLVCTAVPFLKDIP